MIIQEFVIREEDRLWKVRLGRRLVSGQPTRREAICVADALARAAAMRGQRSKILVGTFDGVAVEFPIDGADQPVVDGPELRSV